MKIYLAIFLIFVVTGVYGGEPIEFDGEKYNVAWSDNINGKIVTEYLRDGETVKKWSRMVTVNQYTKARKVEEVLKSYIDSVKPMFAIKPDIFSNTKSKYEDDVLLILTLLAPDKSRYEFIVHRFISGGDLSVSSSFFSFYIPFSEKVNFTPVMKNKNKWITQMFELDIPRVKYQGDSDEDKDTF